MPMTTERTKREAELKQDRDIAQIYQGNPLVERVEASAPKTEKTSVLLTAPLARLIFIPSIEGEILKREKRHVTVPHCHF